MIDGDKIGKELAASLERRGLSINEALSVLSVAVVAVMTHIPVKEKPAKAAAWLDEMKSWIDSMRPLR